MVRARGLALVPIQSPARLQPLPVSLFRHGHWGMTRLSEQTRKTWPLVRFSLRPENSCMRVSEVCSHSSCTCTCECVWQRTCAGRGAACARVRYYCRRRRRWIVAAIRHSARRNLRPRRRAAASSICSIRLVHLAAAGCISPFHEQISAFNFLWRTVAGIENRRHGAFTQCFSFAQRLPKAASHSFPFLFSISILIS